MHDIKHTLPTQLLQLRELLMTRFRAVFTGVNITDAQWRVIRVINELGTVDFSTLSDRSIVAKPSLSRVISSLEARGIVQRAGVEADQRQVELSLAPYGHEFIAGLAPLIDDVYAGLLRDLGDVRMSAVSASIAESIEILEEAKSSISARR
ncbi:MAG: MarR family transcriptional regulator [Leucobacter sp.]